jgi:hypothetical protein
VTHRHHVYEIWATQGQGGDKIAEFKSLADALAYVEQHEGEASYAIKYPNGQWHRWVEDTY